MRAASAMASARGAQPGSTSTCTSRTSSSKAAWAYRDSGWYATRPSSSSSSSSLSPALPIFRIAPMESAGAPKAALNARPRLFISRSKACTALGECDSAKSAACREGEAGEVTSPLGADRAPTREYTASALSEVPGNAASSMLTAARATRASLIAADSSVAGVGTALSPFPGGPDDAAAAAALVVGLLVATACALKREELVVISAWAGAVGSSACASSAAPSQLLDSTSRPGDVDSSVVNMTRKEVTSWPCK
mmetsp:Transcript_32708/g.72250  ORF Transcript_32708/g.72250 Transcript_32708/m.72250 type:complete len:252 (-) Transcript_32708:283-1038(-)